MLHCQHIFCEECVATWFDRDTTCPMCRSDEWTFSIDFRFDRADESVLKRSWSCSWLNLSSCSGQKCLKIQVGETEQQASSFNCSSRAFQCFWGMCVEYQIINSWAAFSTFIFRTVYSLSIWIEADFGSYRVFFLTGPPQKCFDWPPPKLSKCWNHIHFDRHLGVFRSKGGGSLGL